MTWCRHPNLSRPFTIGGKTYKTCPDFGDTIPAPEWKLTPAYTRTQDGKTHVRPKPPEKLLTGIEREAQEMELREMGIEP